MSHGDQGLNAIFDHPPQFEEDTSIRGEFVKRQVAIARGSLILDQPFFGYLLGHFKLIPVSKGILTYAVDTDHIYLNTEYFEDMLKGNPSWKGRVKGILIHLLIHIIYRHHRRQKSRDPKIWSIASDIVVFSHLTEMKEGWVMPSDWDIPHMDIPEELRYHSADKTYQLLLEILLEEISEDQGRGADTTEEDLKTHDNLEDMKMSNLEEMKEEMGIAGNECSMEDIVVEVSETQEREELEEQYFEGMLRTAYERQKGFGSLPEGLDRFINQRISPRIDWKSKLSKYLQRVIVHDLTWTQPNKRLYGQGYYFPGPLKQNTTVILGVDTSGSIEDDELSKFLSESQSILSSITNVKLIVIECDAEVQQVRTFESGEPITMTHTFKGQGGTDFRPVFELVPEYMPDVLIYITDGNGIFPLHPPDVPVIWVLTRDVHIPFGSKVMLSPAPKMT